MEGYSPKDKSFDFFPRRATKTKELIIIIIIMGVLI
jgi:hypothetical protein